MNVTDDSVRPVILPLPVAAFVGWRRLAGQPWRPVCGAATAAECWQRLLRAAAGRSGDLVVTGGERP